MSRDEIVTLYVLSFKKYTTLNFRLENGATISDRVKVAIPIFKGAPYLVGNSETLQRVLPT